MTAKMSNLHVLPGAEISKGVVCWPPALAPAPTGDDGYYSIHRATGAGLARQNADNPYVSKGDLAEEAVRPLEPVAAVTYEQARKYAEAAEKARLGLSPAPAMSDVGKPVVDWKKKTD
jgi:hypothetical protein